MDTHDNQQDLRETLKLLVSGHPLSEAQAWQAFETVMAGRATEAQIGSLLTALAMRSGGPTVAEITGAARAMRNHAMKIEVPPGLEVIDTCGTGGDHSNTFNISTCAALIAAGAGAAVAKHGNRSVTSKSGSSQVLEALGVKLDVGRQTLVRCLQEARICFCFAPQHHPAMKHAIGPRQQLGFRTVFNVLGPLTNPAGATRQVIGVFAPELTEPIAHVVLNLGAEHAMVVHGSTPDGGMDEISTLGPTRITIARKGRMESRDFDAGELGIARATLDELQVETVEDSAAVIRKILAGQKGPARDIAALNAAAAILVAGKAADLSEGYAQACNALDKGYAQIALDKLVHVTNHGH